MADQTAADDDGASAPSRAVSSTVGDSEASGPEQLVGDQVMAEQQQPMAGAAAGGSPDERAGMCECLLCVRVRRSRACVRVCVSACACACACVCVWRTAGDVAPGQPADESMGKDNIPSAADQPYVDPLQALRVDMRRLLEQLEGRKVPLAQVNAAWKQRIGPEFDLKKYQTCKGKKQGLGLKQLLMRIRDTVNIVTAPGPNGKTAVEWAVLIDVAAAWPHKRTDDGSRP